MPLFQQLFRSLPSWPEDDSRWYSTPFGGMYSDPSLAGRTVTKESALAMSAVYACITILSNSIASLPCYIYERQADGGRRRATERIADRILTRRPNGEMSPFRYKQVVMAHLAAWGNHYSYVERDSRGFRSALWPLFPDYMTVRRSDRTRELEYVYHAPRRAEEVFTPHEIFHVAWWGYSGLVGKSPITLARESIGLGLAQEEFSARFYGDGTHPGLVATTPKSLKPETATNLKEALLTQVGGLGKSHRLLLLQEDLKLENISINPVDAEFIASRKFGLQEICRFYRMPPHMIADMDRATFSNIEHQGIEFVTHTLGPWLSLLENEFSKFFLTAEERIYFYFEFNINKFLRGDIKSRFAAFQIAKNSGWLNGDEIRSMENLNPMRDGLGKIYTVQAGVQSLDWLGGEGPAGEPAPTPAALVKMLRVLAQGLLELRERINIDTRGALKGSLADLEERMTEKMSAHATEFSGQLIKAATAINGAFTHVMTLQGEERIKEATSLMVAVKGVKKYLAGVQKQNGAEQQRVWEALKTLPGISDSVDYLRDAIIDSSTALEVQIGEIGSSVMSASGKLSKKVSGGLRELNDLAMVTRTQLADALTQLSESTTVEDAVGELQSVVTTVRGELIEKLGKIHLDTDPIVAALTKSQEDVDARFVAVEEAIKAGITPKMLQGMVQEKFSEGLAGLMHRLDSVEEKLAGIVPEDVVKSIVSGESKEIRDLIEGVRQEPIDLSPLEKAIEDLGTQIVEGRQEPIDLSLLEGAVKDLGAQVNDVRKSMKDGMKLPDPVDLSPLENAVKVLSSQITEGRQEAVDLSPLEGAVKDLAAQINDIRESVRKGIKPPKPVDMEPIKNAIKSLGARIAESRQEPVDLLPLESAVKDLGTQIIESRQEPIDLSPLENAVKDLGAQFNDVRESVKEGAKLPEPLSLKPVEDAIKNLSIQITEGRREPVDLSPLENAVKDIDTKITESRQEPIDLEPMGNAIKDLGAQFSEIQESMKAGVKLSKPVNLKPIEDAIKSLNVRLDGIQKSVQESGGEPTVDLTSLENAIKDINTKITEGRQEPMDLELVEGAIKDLATRFDEIQELVRESSGRKSEPPKPVDLVPLENAVKDLSTRIAESYQESVDLSQLKNVIGDLSSQITEGRQKPVDLKPVEGAIKDLSARLDEVQGMVREKDSKQSLKLPAPVDLSLVEDSIKSLGARSEELVGAMSDAASGQSELVTVVAKLTEAQERMVQMLGEIRSESAAHGKELGAQYRELGDAVASIRSEIDKLKAAPDLSEEDRARLEGLEAKIPELEKKLNSATATRTVANREKVNSQYLPLIQDVLQFIINRECIAVRRALKKFTGKREEMIRWLDDFYGTHPEFISLKLFRLFSSFLEALYTEVAIEGELAETDIPEGFDSFVKKHFDDYVKRHMKASYGYLKGIAGNDDQTATNDIIDTWHNERAQKVAIEELSLANKAVIEFMDKVRET